MQTNLHEAAASYELRHEKCVLMNETRRPALVPFFLRLRFPVIFHLVSCAVTNFEYDCEMSLTIRTASRIGQG